MLNYQRRRRNWNEIMARDGFFEGQPAIDSQAMALSQTAGTGTGPQVPGNQEPAEPGQRRIAAYQEHLCSGKARKSPTQPLRS